MPVKSNKWYLIYRSNKVGGGSPKMFFLESTLSEVCQATHIVPLPLDAEDMNMNLPKSHTLSVAVSITKSEKP